MKPGVTPSLLAETTVHLPGAGPLLVSLRARRRRRQRRPAGAIHEVRAVGHLVDRVDVLRPLPEDLVAGLANSSRASVHQVGLVACGVLDVLGDRLPPDRIVGKKPRVCAPSVSEDAAIDRASSRVVRVFTRPTSLLLVLAVVFSSLTLGAQTRRFFSDDPLWHEPVTQDVKNAARYEPDLVYQSLANLFGNPATRCWVSARRTSTPSTRCPTARST